MPSEAYLRSKNFRKQYTDEIIIDIDDRTERGLLCFMQTGLNLVAAGYHIEIWYANGMKNPHIHVKHILNLDSLSKEEGTRYRKLFYEKYIPKEFWRAEKIDDNQGEIPDWSLCDPYEEGYHPIAQEGRLHHKYNTPKILRSKFNPGNLNQIELDLWEKATTPQAVKVQYHSQDKLLEGSEPLFKKIANKLSILNIADSFGLAPLGDKMRVCPFHSDTNASLSLNADLGVFHCFGCHAKGNIILFYAMLKQLSPNFKMVVSQ